MTDESTVIRLEEPVVAKAERAECEEFCCSSGPRWTAEEAAARKVRRAENYRRASDLLIEAAVAARDDDADKAKALVEIANAWDQIGY